MNPAPTPAPGFDATPVLDVALHKGSILLRLLLAVLAITFCFSNIFWVEEGTIAIRSRWGRLQESGGHFLPPGGPYFALPAPIDRVIRIPTTLQNAAIDDAFYATQRYALVPGIDGSLLTGDKNLVQGQWVADFQIDIAQVHQYLLTVGHLDQAALLIHRAMEQAIVKTVAGMTVDDYIQGHIDSDAIRTAAQGTLDALACGLRLVHVAPKTYNVHPLLLSYFALVNQAQSEKASDIEEARRYREATLSETAGPGYADLLATLDRIGPDTPLDPAAPRPTSVDRPEYSEPSGAFSEITNDARTYRTRTTEQAHSAAARFQLLLAQHRRHPTILRNRLQQDTIQQIFSGDVQSFYLPPGPHKTLYLELDATGPAADRILFPDTPLPPVRDSPEMYDLLPPGSPLTGDPPLGPAQKGSAKGVSP